MNTAFLLAAMYDGAPIIPLARVAEDHFETTEKTFIRKHEAGEIDLPIVRLDRNSQKSARGVHLADLAAFIDNRREIAKREHAAMMSTRR